jgi:cytochrome c oxidase subunit 3
MLLTIIGGAVFVGSQAWEWKNFIKGEYGAVEIQNGEILQFYDIKKDKRIPIDEFAILQSQDRITHDDNVGVWYQSEIELPEITLSEVMEGFKTNSAITVRVEKLDEKGQKIILSREDAEDKLSSATRVVKGANLIRNEYGNPLFADFFFFITGFHGFHVFSGVILNIIIFINVLLGTYERRGRYDMVEKVGLYWHFVDLVWVFVFTFFYLV